METTPKKIAEQAWIEQSTKRWHELESEPTKFDDPFIQGISDYKEALREAIEKAKEENIGGSDFDYGLDDGFKKCLELIETVTPKE